ncbi:MAG: hypothetical protein ABWY12_18405 [Burkholderiales bacterium]
MIMERGQSRRLILLYLFLFALLSSRAAPGCEPASTIKEATPEKIRAFFKGKKMKVLTFVGYSGAEYENKTAMLDHAAGILDRFDPKQTIVNIGATAEGIGAVYETAKRKEFLTAGIVSTQAKENNVELSPCVDVVFYVKDATWGGIVPGTKQLSPTSTAMVEASDVMVAIGGGEVARDELTAARRSGRKVEFIPAEMNHEIARQKALKKGQSAPTDFRGAAGVEFEEAKSNK